SGKPVALQGGVARWFARAIRVRPLPERRSTWGRFGSVRGRFSSGFGRSADSSWRGRGRPPRTPRPPSPPHSARASVPRDTPPPTRPTHRRTGAGGGDEPAPSGPPAGGGGRGERGEGARRGGRGGVGGGPRAGERCPQVAPPAGDVPADAVGVVPLQRRGVH